jgi:hypothetical protein
MDDHLDELVVTEEQPTSPVLAAIRAEREKAAARHVYDLDVPGYGDLLVIRMGPLGGTQATRLRERWTASKDPNKDFNLNADTIISACREVLGRPTPMEPLQPLAPEPLVIDHELADTLQLPVESLNGAKPTARQVLRALFSAAHDPDLAIGVAGGEFMAWLASADEQVSEEALGES